MRLDVYQEETERTAHYQSEILEVVRAKLLSGEYLSRLEQNGMLHALQVLVENAIGKSKHLLKSAEREIPVSAYDSFAELVNLGLVDQKFLKDWYRAVGLRNRIVHEYMNIDMELVFELVKTGQYSFVVEFLLKPIISR